MTSQRGGFAMGLVAGLLIGLALALGVALYITKAPIPFMNKVPQRTAEMDTAEALRNRNWDPNAALGGRTAARAASAAAQGASAAAAASGVAAPVAAVLPPAAGASRVPATPAAPASAARPAARDPAAILAGETPPAAPAAPARSTAPGAEPFVYFVQAGAFTRTEEAEQQRARLAMMGQGAKITEREQAGRTVYRVRMGPYPTRGEADALQVKLQEQGIEAQLVRVEKP
jgi:cell division protein FtsN